MLLAPIECGAEEDTGFTPHREAVLDVAQDKLCAVQLNAEDTSVSQRGRLLRPRGSSGSLCAASPVRTASARLSTQ